MKPFSAFKLENLSEVEIKDFLARRITAKDIAKKYNVNLSIVYKFFYERNIKRSPILPEELVEKYERNEISIEEIAKLLNQSKFTIVRKLCSIGIKKYSQARKFTVQEMQALQSFARGETSLTEIKTILKVSKQRIYQILNRLNIQKTKFVVTDKQIKQLQSGETTVADVAQQLGCIKQTVVRRLKKKNVKLPKLGRRKFLFQNRKIVISELDVQDYVNDKLTARELAIKYKCSKACISDALRRQKAKKTKRYYHKFQLTEEEVNLLLNGKMSYIEMAKLKNVCDITIRHALERQTLEKNDS